MSALTVYQDLVITGPEDTRQNVRIALIESASKPWHFDKEGSAKAESRAIVDDGLMIFEREHDEILPMARLVLWPETTGFSVPNIVPAEIGELTMIHYNALLQDFADAVAKPVARRFGWTVSITSAQQSLEDWLDETAATALRRFSAAANKSTGASHPADERRWFDFILAVHRGGRQIGTDRLARWLHEIEGWDEDSSHKLAGEFERSVALLLRDAETR